MRTLRLRTLMIAVAIMAFALVSPSLTTSVVLLAASGFAIRSHLRRPVGARGWAVPYFVTLACLYLPFAWVVFDFPWDDYRKGWIQMWPVLPGLIAGITVHPNDAAVMFISGVASLLLVLLLTTLGRRGRASLVVANLLALIGAGLESGLAYQLFLM